MEYIYAAAMLHELDREINEQNMKPILEAAGADVSESRIKALIAALEGVDLQEAVEKASGPAVGAGGDAAGEMPEGEAGEGADESLPKPTGDEVEEGDDGDDLDEMFG